MSVRICLQSVNCCQVQEAHRRQSCPSLTPRLLFALRPTTCPRAGHLIQALEEGGCCSWPWRFPKPWARFWGDLTRVTAPVRPHCPTRERPALQALPWERELITQRSCYTSIWSWASFLLRLHGPCEAMLCRSLDSDLCLSPSHSSSESPFLPRAGLGWDLDMGCGQVFCSQIVSLQVPKTRSCG